MRSADFQNDPGCEIPVLDDVPQDPAPRHQLAEDACQTWCLNSSVGGSLIPHPSRNDQLKGGSLFLYISMLRLAWTECVGAAPRKTRPLSLGFEWPPFRAALPRPFIRGTLFRAILSVTKGIQNYQHLRRFQNSVCSTKTC